MNNHITELGDSNVRIRSLTLILTRQCNASCRHCVTLSSPYIRDHMDQGLARRAVEQASALGLRVIFSGGEPTLRKDLLRELIQLAAKCNAPSIGLFSNAHWASSAAHAKTFLSDLQVCGLDTLLLSKDVFHNEFISPHNVDYAAHAAKQLGLHCEVSITSEDGKLQTSESNLQLRALLGNQAVRTHLISFVGRAESPGQLNAGTAISDKPCAVIGQLALTTAGDVYACCASAITFGYETQLYGGSIRSTSLEKIIIDLASNSVLQDIQRLGPYGAAFNLIASGKSKTLAPQLESKKGYCEFCHAVTQHTLTLPLGEITHAEP